MPDPNYVNLRDDNSKSGNVRTELVVSIDMASITIPNELRDAARSRLLLPIIGAGFTKNIDNAFPDWSQVIDTAADELGYDPDIIKLHGDYLQIAEYYSILKNDTFELAYKLAQTLDSGYDVSRSQPHLLLPYLDTVAIYTTNWDSWIEKGFEDQGIEYLKVVIPDHLVSPDHKHIEPKGTPIYNLDQTKRIKTRYHETQIIKFHGDFSRPQSIVMKESDYFNRLDFEDALDIRLRADIIGRSVLFIGHSFSDLNIRYMWYKLMRIIKGTKTNPKSFFVTHHENPILEKILSNQNIQVILLDPRDIKESLTGLLKTIIEEQTR